MEMMVWLGISSSLYNRYWDFMHIGYLPRQLKKKVEIAFKCKYFNRANWTSNGRDLHTCAIVQIINHYRNAPE